MSKLIDNVEEKITGTVNKLGYEIEYTEYVKEGENKIFRVVIDKENVSLTTEDCEKVSRAIEDDVDKLMKDEAYVLEVSSPGLERQLKNTRLFNKYLGSKIFLKLFKKVEDKKELEGILKSADDEKIELEVEENVIWIERKNIACANTVYEFWEE